MSALWVLALGVSAGYMMSKRVAMESAVERAKKEYDLERVVESTGGSSSTEIRAAKYKVYCDEAFSPGVSSAYRAEVGGAQSKFADEVATYEAGPSAELGWIPLGGSEQ